MHASTSAMAQSRTSPTQTSRAAMIPLRQPTNAPDTWAATCATAGPAPGSPAVASHPPITAPAASIAPHIDASAAAATVAAAPPAHSMPNPAPAAEAHCPRHAASAPATDPAIASAAAPPRPPKSTTPLPAASAHPRFTPSATAANAPGSNPSTAAAANDTSGTAAGAIGGAP